MVVPWRILLLHYHLQVVADVSVDKLVQELLVLAIHPCVLDRVWFHKATFISQQWSWKYVVPVYSRGCELLFDFYFELKQLLFYPRIDVPFSHQSILE